MTSAASLDRRIVSIAVPAAGSAMLQLIHGAVDMYWVGSLGTEALAALAIATMSVWMFAALGTLVSTGITALVARYVGAGRPDGAAYVGLQGLGWAAALGLAAAGIGYVLAPWIYAVSNAAPGVAAQGIVYTRIFWGGGVLTLLQLASDAVFRGHGNARVPFLAGAVAIVLNFVLDPLLIHGAGPVPALGVAGAAWATLAATLVGSSIVVAGLVRRGFVSLRRPPDERMRLVPTTLLGRPRLLGLDPAVLRRVLRVGLPLAASGLFFTAIYLGIHNIAGRVGGSAAQAGLGIGHRGESLAWVMCVGWAAAASALVGQNLGAGRPEEAARAAWRAVVHAAVLSTLWAAVLFVFADPVAGFLTGFDEGASAARANGVDYNRIVAVCLGAQAIDVVLQGAFGGAGLTLPPMLISGFFSLLRIPLSILFAEHLGLGPPGIWGVITGTALLRGVVSGVWFARGTWKTRTV